jgi:hypothetical protein
LRCFALLSGFSLFCSLILLRTRLP